MWQRRFEIVPRFRNHTKKGEAHWHDKHFQVNHFGLSIQVEEKLWGAEEEGPGGLNRKDIAPIARN